MSEQIRLWIFWITVVFLLGWVAPLLRRRHHPAQPGKLAFTSVVGLALALLGSLASLGWGVWFFLHLGTPPSYSVELLRSSWMTGQAGSPLDALPPLVLSARVDMLAAFFVILTAGFAACVAVYSFGALRAAHYARQSFRVVSGFNLFVWSTLMTILANDAFTLIGSLEIMTLAFAYLTLYKHNLYLDSGEEVGAEKAKSARLAPQVYLMASHASTALLVMALLLLAINATRNGAPNGMSFEALRGVRDTLAPQAAWTTVIFLLALAGLGIRAGLTPAHVWVPLVHPASPTTTHAFSLGIAIKVVLYLMIRFFFEFMQPSPGLGILVALVGAVTALVNVWFAAASHDLKVALAYHSVENIGIITVGIGLAVAFRPDYPLLSMLALLAALYHLLNHAVFKGLLYLCTGSIDYLTHQVVEMDRLGGLIKLFPWTSALVLVGAVAISGFPPFNGFISEWMTLQSLFSGLAVLKSSISIEILAVLICVIFLATSFALTAFCFYKITGTALLGRPRSTDEERATWEKHDVPWSMRLVMLLLAVACLLLGVFAIWVLQYVLAPVVQPILGDTTQVLQVLDGKGTLNFGIAPNDLKLTLTLPAVKSMAVIALLLAAGGVVISLMFGGGRKTRASRRPPEVWNCGTPYEPTQMQYPSGALSFLLRDLINVGRRSGARRGSRRARKPLPDILPSALTITEEPFPQVMTEWFRLGYNQVAGWLQISSQAVGAFLQNRDIRRYLLYILLVNLLMLIIILLTGGQGGSRP